jgi:DNA-binding NarL/FixJ family response regulator
LSDAKRILENNRFDVILLDLLLPDGKGEDLLEYLQTLSLRPPVAVISGHVDSGRIVRLMGQCDVTVPKPIGRADLLGLVETLRDRSSATRSVDNYCHTHGLSPRERDVIRAAAEGMVNKEIAYQLGCMPGTIATYWRRIYRKTGLTSQREVLAALIANTPGKTGSRRKLPAGDPGPVDVPAEHTGANRRMHGPPEEDAKQASGAASPAKDS